MTKWLKLKLRNNHSRTYYWIFKCQKKKKKGKTDKLKQNKQTKRSGDPVRYLDAKDLSNKQTFTVDNHKNTNLKQLLVKTELV